MTQLLLSLLLLLPLQNNGNTVLSVTPSTRHFDSIQEGIQYHTAFEITNSSNKDVSLIYISAECDCTLEMPLKGSVPAHGTFTLPVRFSVDNSSNLNERITIFTNVPNQEIIEIYLTGTVSTTVDEDGQPDVKTEKALFSSYNGYDNTIHLLFFYKRGCSHCEAAEKNIESLKEKYPGLLVHSYPLDNSDSIAYAEYIGAKRKVPEDIRLRTPLAIAGSQYLASDSITREGLEKIFHSGDPLLSKKPDKKGSGSASLIARARSLAILPVLAAGLLDGVNPCAFATIIFFVSFLRVLKRNRMEILIIGLTFSTAVYGTYFLTGIGFLAGLKPLVRFPWFSMSFYALSGMLALVLALLNLRDAFRAHRGEIKEMTLQLPQGIKKRIHQIISERSRRSGLVAGAFITGVAISLLELGCTGQVYLPVITYILQVPSMRSSGIFYLALYNLAFILPLLIIFALVFFGTGWENLNRWFLRHLVTSRLLLFLLFMILALAIGFNLYQII